MPKKVAKIDGIFSIEGRGTIITLPRQDQWTLSVSEEIHRRERIQIRKPDGGHLSTFIKDIDMIRRGPNQGGVAFGLPASVTPEAIPAGSELWLERDGTEPLIEP